MEEKKRERIYRAIMLIIVTALITFVTTTALMYNGSIKYVMSNTRSTPNNGVAKKIDALLATVTELIDEKYVGDVDQGALIDGALKGMVESVGDVYTEYYSEEDLKEFEEQTLGNFVGVGVYLQGDKETGIIEVISPIKGSPADEAGLKAGDQITKADGTEYDANTLQELTNYIKGEEGTDVTLTIKRGEETFDVKLTRKNVHLKYVASEKINDNLGYILITTFDKDCAQDFADEYNKLVEEGAKAIIIDLRNNGGGLVDEALKIADLICEKGETMLVTSDKDGKEKVAKSENERSIKMPIAILTNEGTASASEILIAALKENDKAEIVGEKTFGKGVIQELVYLSNGGALKVTSAEYYTPQKNKINKVGIEPDFEVKFDYSKPEVDEQYVKAIEVLNDKLK